MNSKLTPEQAIIWLRGTWPETVQTGIGTDGVRLLHEVADIIESLAADAELGRVAAEAIGNKSPYPCQYPLFIDGSSICKMCTWPAFCRLRAGKGVE